MRAAFSLPVACVAKEMGPHGHTHTHLRPAASVRCGPSVLRGRGQTHSSHNDTLTAGRADSETQMKIEPDLLVLFLHRPDEMRRSWKELDVFGLVHVGTCPLCGALELLPT